MGKWYHCRIKTANVRREPRAVSGASVQRRGWVANRNVDGFRYGYFARTYFAYDEPPEAAVGFMPFNSSPEIL